MKHVEELVRGSVLDMGTGSGIQAVAAALKPDVEYVLAVDINPEAVEAAKERATDAGVISKMRFLVSDLFTNVKERFDWIIFNPPYLPSEGDVEDPTWAGGENGGETIERFLEEANKPPNAWWLDTHDRLIRNGIKQRRLRLRLECSRGKDPFL